MAGYQKGLSVFCRWEDAYSLPACLASLKHSLEVVAREGGREEVGGGLRQELEQEAGSSGNIFRGLVIAFPGQLEEESLSLLQARY